MYIVSKANNKVLMRQHQVLISINKTKNSDETPSELGTPCENRTHN